MSQPRRRPDRSPLGRRDADERAWDLICADLRELREDVGDLARDVAELVAWKSRSEERDRTEGRRMVNRRNAIAFWVGIVTGAGGLVLAAISRFAGHG